MEHIYIDNKNFDKVDFQKENLLKGEYENCSFLNCDFSNVNLSKIKFINCDFIACNISLANLTKTFFQDVKFRDCKMLGLNFSSCNDFGLFVYFENCILDHSSFYKMKIKKTIFKHSQLHEVDFSEGDLTGVVFDNCDLTRTLFDHTILEKADFSSAFNYSLDPELNRIKQAKFSLPAVVGLLDKYKIEIDN